MYPDLSYLFHDFFGTARDNWTSIFKTFGLFFVLAILAAAYVLYKELKRKAQQGLFAPVKTKIIEGTPPTWSDYVVQGITGFVLGGKLLYVAQHFAEFKEDAAAVLLSFQGSLIGALVGTALALASKWWEGQQAKKKGVTTTIKDIYPHDRIGDITLVAAISGVIGAKLFDVMENIPALLRDPLGVLLSGGGLAIYGGLIMGFICTYIYLKRKGIPPIHVMDAVAPALILSYAIGRMGCQFSGDGDWGIVNANPMPGWWFLPDWAWAFDYPHNIIREGIPIEGCSDLYCTKLAEKVYPAPIYEITASLIIFAILWLLRKRIQAAGLLFFIYTFLNGMERFAIESIRINKRYDILGMHPTQAEMIAVGLMLTGIIGGIVCYRRWKATT